MSALTHTLEHVRLGEPVVRRNLTIIPLYREDPALHDRLDYVPLEEALASGQVKITEISEGGSVPTLAVENLGDSAVFILDGEELIGAKQNRVVNLSILVPAKSTLPIPVSCVEQGRWSYRTARTFLSSPQALFQSARAMQMAYVSDSLRKHGSRDGDQQRLWERLIASAEELGTTSPTEAMHDSYTARRDSLAEYVAELEPEPDQVGAVFAIGGRVAGAELFETPELFASYYRKVAESYALDALRHRSEASPPAAGAESLIADLQKAQGSSFRAIGLGEDVRIDEAHLVGGALLYDDRVVHLAAFRQ